MNATERRPYSYPEMLEGRPAAESELLTAAKHAHDHSCCTCDPKYLFTCQIFRQAIIDADLEIAMWDET